MTKQEILVEFKDLNHVYNDCTKLDNLKHMLDELERENCRMFRKNPEANVTECGRFIMSDIEGIKEEINKEIARLYMYRDYANGLADAVKIIDKHIKRDGEQDADSN